MKSISPAAVLAAFVLAAVPSSFVHAHVTLEYQVASAGQPYKATFRVGHGCAGSPTRQLSVAIPAGVRGAKPMVKPGWNIEVQRDTLARPYSSHGRQVTEDVVRITWTAATPKDHLGADHYDEFVLVARAPTEPGPVYWLVSQICEQGRLDWTEVPRPGQSLSQLKLPAAYLEVMPAGPAGHHH